MEHVNKRILEYDYLRVVATLLVVISHCTYYRIANSTYGAMDYSGLAANGCFMLSLAGLGKNFLYLFHMPLFFALSGALFFDGIKKQRYRSARKFINGKARSLLIPFLLVTFFYSVPIKVITGYYEGNFLRNIICGQLLLQGNTHLWFLPTFFCIFLASWFLEYLS